MNVRFINLEGEVFNLVFNEEITIKLIQQRLLKEFNYNTYMFLFCISNQIILNETHFKEMIAKEGLDKPIIIFNPQIYQFKFYPSYDNSFHFNSSRYSDFFFNPTIKTTELQSRDFVGRIISSFHTPTDMTPPQNIVTSYSNSDTSDSDNEDQEDIDTTPNEHEFIDENDLILNSNVIHFNELAPFGMIDEIPQISQPNERIEAQLRTSIANRDIDMIDFISNHFNLPDREEGETVLHVAARESNRNIISHILNNYNGNANNQNILGFNRNINFSEQDNQTIMRLIQAGFDSETVIQVYEACDRNEEEALNLLISMG